MNKKVLIIDDNIVICEMYQAVLENEWYEVKIEHDGLKWINLAVEFNPDLILLDIMMPQCDWYEVLETLNMHSSLNATILINSNLTSDDDEKKGLDLWAVKFLRKADFTPAEIVAEIKKVFWEWKESSSKKILVIDDNKEICEMYKIVLESKWFDVKLEYNWLHWLTSAIEYKPDLIILDIMMPEINGFEVLESIKWHSDLKTLVVVNSNLFWVDDEKKALDLWATKYLRKSYYTPVQVVDVIVELLD